MLWLFFGNIIEIMFELCMRSLVWKLREVKFEGCSGYDIFYVGIVVFGVVFEVCDSNDVFKSIK